MTAKDRKRLFIENETALTQAEPALIIGCQAREVQLFIKPSFILNNRPKYRQADVIKMRDKFIASEADRHRRNRAMMQNA